MEPWLMWLVGVGVAALPFLLMAAFHGTDTADSRGRRTDRRWRASDPARQKSEP